MAVKVRQKRQKKKRDDILAEFVYNRGSVSKMKTEKMKETGEQKMKAYDYVVIGSGLYGAVFAREAVKKGNQVVAVCPESLGGLESPRLGDDGFDRALVALSDALPAGAFDGRH